MGKGKRRMKGEAERRSPKGKGGGLGPESGDRGLVLDFVSRFGG